MKCPKCQYRFHPLKVVLISRWSSLVCPECQSRWNRRIDLQLILVTIVPLSVMSLCALLPLEFRIKILVVLALGLITLFFMMFVDAATIQLVVAKKRIGWWKIIGDKMASSTKLDTTRRMENKERK